MALATLFSALIRRLALWANRANLGHASSMRLEGSDRRAASALRRGGKHKIWRLDAPSTCYLGSEGRMIS
jgi:hypothetical protein